MQTSTFVSGLLALGLTAAQSFSNTTRTGTGSVITPTPVGPTAGTPSVVLVTETVDVVTVFCPLATQITTNGQTYTATAGQTITVTDCPCTQVKTLPAPGPTGAPALPPVVGNASVVWTTQTVDVFTTYCPAATQITTNGRTYTATASQTLTITDCPCTVSAPVTVRPPVVTPAIVTPYKNGTTNGTVVYQTSTTVVQTLTTVCPAPTTLTIGTNTIPVPVPTTLTLSAPVCPCTSTVVSPRTTVIPAPAPPAPTQQPRTTVPAPAPPAPTQQPGAPGVVGGAGPSGSPAASTRAATNSIATGAAGTIGSSFMAVVAAALAMAA